MVRAEHTVTVNRPVSEVFAYLTDVDNLAQWQDSVIEARKDSEGPVTTGTRFTEARKFLGRRVESTMEVTEHDPERRFSLKVLSGPVPFQVSHAFEEANGGTRIRIVVEGEPGGFFKVAEPLVGRQAKRQLQGDFDTLKDLLESGSAGPPGS